MCQPFAVSPVPYIVGRMAFFGQNVALEGRMIEAYPNGCTLREAMAWAATLSTQDVIECLVIG